MTTIATNMPLGLKKLNTPTDTVKQRELRNACHDFEAIILKQMLDSMRKSVLKSNLLGEEGQASKMYQSMRDDEMAKEMARGKGMGLGEVLYNQLAGRTKTIGK